MEEVQATTIKLERNYLAACDLPLIHAPDQPVKVTPLNDLQPLVVIEVQEVCVIEDESQLAPYQVPKDEQEGDSPILNEPEPIVAPFESHAEFQENEGEDLNTQECSLVPLFSEDENFQNDEEEPQVNQVEISQQEISSLPITSVVQEQLDPIPLQQKEPLLVQPEDDVPYTFPTIMHLEVVLQGPEIDQSLDIIAHHDPVELRMVALIHSRLSLLKCHVLNPNQ
jgi:hypothetical protein